MVVAVMAIIQRIQVGELRARKGNEVFFRAEVTVIVRECQSIHHRLPETVSVKRVQSISKSMSRIMLSMRRQ